MTAEGAVRVDVAPMSNLTPLQGLVKQGEFHPVSTHDNILKIPKQKTAIIFVKSCLKTVLQQGYNRFSTQELPQQPQVCQQGSIYPQLITPPLLTASHNKPCSPQQRTITGWPAHQIDVWALQNEWEEWLCLLSNHMDAHGLNALLEQSNVR